MTASEFKTNSNFINLYGDSKAAAQRYERIGIKFSEYFAGEPCFFSTSGRIEIIGNHTDHNGGKVLAGSISLDTVAAACKTDENIICLKSEGYDECFFVDLTDLSIHEQEKGTTFSLIRGVAARFVSLGFNIGGFNAFISSNVLKGSGLSSSAAFEVLICTMLSYFYNEGKIKPETMGEIAQYAENVYFGKPCGLMDQLACACGSIVAIDFRNKAADIRHISYDFTQKGYSLIITDVRQDHADLTEEYAAIIADMASVAGYFGKDRLCQVPPDCFKSKLCDIRKVCSDRAVLRAMHFYDENHRVDAAVAALESGDLQNFFAAVNASGMSSQCLLQNMYKQGSECQGIPLALMLARKLLAGRGAVRIHGGGFGGTILAFVPFDLREEYIKQMDAVFGEGAACELSVRAMSTDRII